MPTATKKTTKKKVEKAVMPAVDSGVVLTAQANAASEVAKNGSFISAVGRRKSAVARVRLVKNGAGVVTVNGKKMSDFFGTDDLRAQVISPLKAVGHDKIFDVSVSVDGGGVRGQAEAIRLGVARALCEFDIQLRTTLKKLGYLTRDPRVRERKKPGKRSARRSPQWSKR